MIGNKKVRTLIKIDNCFKEVLAIELDTSQSTKRAIHTLVRIIEQKAKQVSLELIMVLSFGAYIKEFTFGLSSLASLGKMD